MFKIQNLLDFFFPKLMISTGGGGGGGNSGGGTSIQELPEWARGYAKDTLEKGAALTETPYQTYGQPRIAGFGAMQLNAQNAAANMRPNAGVVQGVNIADTAALQGLKQNYQGGGYGNQFQAPEAYQAGRFGARDVRAPQLQNYQMRGPQDVSAIGNEAAQMQAAQTSYNPQLQNYQMGPAQQVSSQNFTGQAAQDYMSPYMQNVVDAQQREAQRASDIQGQQNAARAVGQGAFGGSRAALVEAERQRNLAIQKGDIQAQGLQSAYQQAQSQFNADQTRQLQAQQANQQAGLTTSGQNLAANLGVQQLGTQTGLQTALSNLGNQQQANVQNQAAQLQAMGLNSTQALQAALANQQAGLTTGQQNLQALLGVQNLGASQNLQAQQLNQAARLQAQQLGEQSRQFGYGQGMTGASLGAQYGQAANQLNEQAKQFGANLGLQGLNTAIQGANTMGALGQQQFQQGMDINKLQNAYGGQQQALRQQGLDQAYQDFLNQQNYPYKQLGFMSDLIRGLPLGQQTARQMYEAAPSTAQQIGSLGLGAYGLSKFMAAGGMAYADGGEVARYNGSQGSVTSRGNVEEITHELKTDQELQRALKAAQARGDIDELEAVQNEIGMRASMRKGLASAVTPQMADRMAGGGIVAFAKGGDAEDDDSTSRMVVSKGDPAVYGAFGRYGMDQLKKLNEMKAYEALTPEQRAELDKANFARIQAFGGEDPYGPMAERIKGFNADLADQRERGKGAVALQMAGDIIQPGNRARAVGKTFSTMGQGMSELDAAQAREKRALAGMEFNLSDAQRKERMAAGREAINASKDIEANRLAAHTAERADLVAGITGAGKFAQAFRPVGAGGGAGSKLPQVDRQAAAIAQQIVDLKGKNPNDPAIKPLQDKLTELKAIIATGKDMGPNKMEAAANTLTAAQNRDLSKHMGDFVNSAAYKKAEKAGTADELYNQEAARKTAELMQGIGTRAAPIKID